jgi:excisionase family DNA binding protein
LACLRPCMVLLSQVKRKRKMKSNEPLWTSKQVAEFLHLSQSTVVRYARERILPSVNVGPHLKRFRPEAIQRFLERNSADEANTSTEVNSESSNVQHA